jgi:hypothetical protein
VVDDINRLALTDRHLQCRQDQLCLQMRLHRPADDPTAERIVCYGDMPNGNPAPGPLNSRYFRPVRRKETRARRWDLQFGSTSPPAGSLVRT